MAQTRTSHCLRESSVRVTALVETFNGRLRDECPDANWFLSFAEARNKIEKWRRHYNESCAHTALGWLTPQEFALAAAL